MPNLAYSGEKEYLLVMPNWFYLVLTVINVVSLLGLYMFMRKIKEANRRQIHLLGEKNRRFVLNWNYYLTVYLYYAVVFAFLIFTYFIFDFNEFF